LKVAAAGRVGLDTHPVSPACSVKSLAQLHKNKRLEMIKKSEAVWL